MPFYPASCQCIAGFLDDEDQFWKVNFHWELLTKMLNTALAKKDLKSREAVRRMLGEMMLNSPDPTSGYLESTTVGIPRDKSSHSVITQRWLTMKACKMDFRRIIDAERLTFELPPAKRWDLAVAPVARPGTSKHGTGYALDIEGFGQNAVIREISLSRGATLAFDEKSHVHVEFARGVKIPRDLAKAERPSFARPSP